MTEGDIILEFRQICALEKEKRTGQPYQESETLYDSEYTNYLRSQGFSEEYLKEHGYE